jgi:hypothetical protein
MRKSLLLDNTFGIKGTASYYSQGSSSRTARENHHSSSHP